MSIQIKNNKAVRVTPEIRIQLTAAQIKQLKPFADLFNKREQGVIGVFGQIWLDKRSKSSTGYGFGSMGVRAMRDNEVTLIALVLKKTQYILVEELAQKKGRKK